MRRFKFFALGFVLIITALITRPRPSSAHIPITTKIMFNKEVVRILQRNCVGCHRPGGITFSLETYDDARPWAKDLEYEMLRRAMPPWGAVKGFGDFSNTRLMTPRDLEVLVNWVENGVPEGEAKDLPKEPLHSDAWQLGAPDLMLQPESPVSVASGSNSYETVVIPTNLKQDRWIRAIDLMPTDGALVHCAAFYVQPAADSPADKRSPGQFLGYWMPGQKTVEWPSGSAVLLPAGSNIVARIHYRGSDSDKTDRSEIGLYFSQKDRQRDIRAVNIDQPEYSIPAAAGLQRTMASATLSEDS